MIKAEEKYFLDKFLLGVIKHRREHDYRPLEIIFNMSAPIALNHPWMHFDGLIAHLFFLDALGNDYYLLPAKFPFSRLLKNVRLPRFPILKTDGLYHASVSILDTDRKALEILYKRFEDRWIRGKKKISMASGYYRNYMIQHIYMPARKIHFYVFGDKDIIGELLSNVVGIGDNYRIGWGAVRSIEINTIKKDFSIIKDGKAMRPIPMWLLRNSSEIYNLAWKPPYWAPESIAECAPPGAKIEFK